MSLNQPTIRPLLTACAVTLLAALSLAALLGPTTTPRPARAQNGEVLLRLVHAIPDQLPIDVYVDGARVAQNLAPGTATPHLRFPAGAAEIVVRRGNSDRNSPVLAQTQLNLATTGGGFGHVALVFQLDGFEQPTLVSYEDILTPTPLGQSRLQVIHAAPGGPNVDVYTAAGAFFVPDVPFAESTSVDPPVGAVTLQLRPAGGAQVLAQLPGSDLSSGFLYTVLVLPANDELNAVLLQAPVLPAPDAPTSQVQIVHAASAAGPLDLYLDEAAVVPNFTAGDVVVHAPYPSGTYTLAVRNAGIPATADAAAELPVNLSGTAVTLVLSGDLADGSFRVDVLEDFVFSMDADTARVRVVNGSPNGPLTLDIAGDDLPAAQNLANILPPGEATTEQTLAAGFYRLDGVVDDAELGGPFFIEAQNVPFVGGAAVTLLVYNDMESDEPTLRVESSFLRTGPESLLGFDAAPPPTATPTATRTPTETPLPPTLTPTPVTGTPPIPAEQPLMTGRVALEPDTNLQCREFPSAVSRALVQIPGQTLLVVNGYATELDPDGNLAVPLDPARFVDIESRSTFDQVWVQVDFFGAADGVARCWVRADFLQIFYYDGAQFNAIGAPAGFFGFVAISPPIIIAIPANTAGQIFPPTALNLPEILQPTPTPRASLTPTPPPSATPSITPTPDAFGRAQMTTLTPIYERANTATPVLREVPAGSIVSLLGRTLDGTLVNVRYEALGEGTTIGWVAVENITVLEGEIASLPVRN
jgi:hypothetical protein